MLYIIQNYYQLIWTAGTVYKLLAHSLHLGQFGRSTLMVNTVKVTGLCILVANRSGHAPKFPALNTVL